MWCDGTRLGLVLRSGWNGPVSTPPICGSKPQRLKTGSQHTSKQCRGRKSTQSRIHLLWSPSIDYFKLIVLLAVCRVLCHLRRKRGHRQHAAIRPRWVPCFCTRRTEQSRVTWPYFQDFTACPAQELDLQQPKSIHAGSESLACPCLCHLSATSSCSAGQSCRWNFHRHDVESRTVPS